jgi:hypothetical protein
MLLAGKGLCCNSLIENELRECSVLDLKSVDRKVVPVQVRSSVPDKKQGLTPIWGELV